MPDPGHARRAAVPRAHDRDGRVGGGLESADYGRPQLGAGAEALRLLRDFLEEARENLASIELNFLSLETNPGDLEAINAIFRPFHSIKGVAEFLNLKDIHHLSHEAENLLDEARSNKLSITDMVIDLILRAADFLKSMLADVENSVSQGVPIPSSADLVNAFSKQLSIFHTEGLPGSGPMAKKVGEILVEREVVKPEVVEEAAASSKCKGTKLGEEP